MTSTHQGAADMVLNESGCAGWSLHHTQSSASVWYIIRWRFDNTVSLY